jgi:hypothetical protein
MTKILGGLMDASSIFSSKPMGKVIEHRREGIKKAIEVRMIKLINVIYLHYIDQSITAGTVKFNIADNPKVRSSSCSRKVKTDRRIDGPKR